MPSRIELLAPGGDPDSIKAAIVAGADAIYCGLIKWSARNRATNLSFEQLYGVLRLAHQHDCRVYLTLNIIIVESDLPELFSVLNRLANTSVDGVIVQDLGLMHLLSRYYPGLVVHGSTQLTTHNEGQIRFLGELGATRVNLSRELSLDEITALTRTAQEQDLSTEVFVHGSYCISFSGLCYMSSVQSARSGNRGRCSQPCRDRHETTSAGKDYPLNLKDNSAFHDLEALHDAGVAALKIEGRVKKFHYVHTVTRAWSNRLGGLYEQSLVPSNAADLHKVFNRDFTNGYLAGDISQEMFSDHPRNSSARRLNEETGSFDASYEQIAQNQASVREVIDRVEIGKAPLTITVSGAEGSPLSLTVKTPDTSYEVHSEARLEPQSPETKAQQLTRELFLEKLGGVNDSEFFIEHLDLSELQPDLFVPFREIPALRNEILFILRGKKEPVKPVALPVLERADTAGSRPTLSVLISSLEDLSLADETGAELHFQLPSRLENNGDDLAGVFAKHRRLVPWFPPILIGPDYDAAVAFLRRVRPARLVTNNTGIAHEAAALGVGWIAGPQLNTANSFTLLCLQERLGCTGAFISNELNRDQIQRIKRPDGFELHYSLFHPAVLMTSRQCLFHQVTGCDHSRVDRTCLSDCEKSASITNLKHVSSYIHKSRGNYANIFHGTHFLNTDIVTDLPGLFSNFLIDLRDIKTATRIAPTKPALIQLFDNLLGGDPDSAKALAQAIAPTSATSYSRGI